MTAENQQHNIGVTYYKQTGLVTHKPCEKGTFSIL